MKKGGKIALITLAILFVLGLAIFVSADVLVSRFVKLEVDETLAALPAGEASCGKIQIRLFSGTAEVSDLHYAYPPAIDISIDKLEVGRVFYSALWAHQIRISDVRIQRPTATIVYNSQFPDSLMPHMQDSSLAHAGDFFESASLARLKINEASLVLRDTATGLAISIDSTSLRLHDLSYSWVDSVFRYNDSIYRIDVAGFSCYVPEEPMQIDINDIHTRNGKELTTGNAHIKHAVHKKALGNRRKEPVTWIDLEIADVKTSNINLFRKALTQDLTLDSLAVNVKRMDVFRDERYKPKKPFPMPQEILVKMPVTFAVNHVDASVQRINIEFSSTDINCGEMHINNIRAAVEHLTNKRGSIMHIYGNCPIDKGGRAKAEMHMSLNKACDWNGKIHVQNINTNYLNTFLRPLVGITCDCHIDTLDTEYKGNSIAANGTFRMLYHGLNVQVHKEDDIPYKIVTKNAAALTTIANTLIPKSNPTKVDIHPRAYAVTWKRNEWQPFPLFLFGPCIDGAKETMLPGLYVHKQVKK